MTKLIADQFTMAFKMTETLSLMALVETCGYSAPTGRTPWAEKKLADGSTLQFHRDAAAQLVIAVWVGEIEDWGAMRFAIDNIYRDLATIGYVTAPEATTTRAAHAAAAPIKPAPAVPDEAQNGPAATEKAFTNYFAPPMSRLGAA